MAVDQWCNAFPCKTHSYIFMLSSQKEYMIQDDESLFMRENACARQNKTQKKEICIRTCLYSCLLVTCTHTRDEGRESKRFLFDFEANK
jgi:hypothetical protein